MTIDRRKLNTFLIYAFVFVCAFMPAESFGMKELFLGVLLVANIRIVFDKLINNRALSLFGIILPAWLFFISAFAGGRLIDSIRAVYIFTFIWVACISIECNVNLKKIFLDVVFLLAIFTDALVVLHATGIMPLLSNPIALWMNEVGNAQLSYGDVAIFYYVFFLNAAPLMLFALVDALYQEKGLRAVVVFIALLWSGTRANIYLAFVCVAAYALVYKKNDWKKIAIISGGGIAIAYLAIRLAPIIAKKISTINLVKTDGDSIRAERTAAAIREIFGNAKTFWMGMGANVPFRANGILNYSSEMSYIEIWRIFGIISLVGVISMLVFLLWKNRKDANTIAYVAYLSICAVDPFLMTSTGFLMIMYMFYLYMSKSQTEDIEKNDPFRKVRFSIWRIKFRVY